MNTVLIKRLFAALIFLTFTFMAAPILLRSESPEPAGDTSLALSNLAVPEELGKVQERFTGSPATPKGNNLRTIVQIQDVHAHATAQQNIAAILERLRVVFGIKTAALEGAWISTSLPKSHAIPTSREKQLLAGTLLDDDRISGPVYAAIMSPEPITLVGIEDEASYEKNRALFLDHLGKTKKIDETLLAYGASLQESQRSTWGPELSVFGNTFGKFRDTSDLGKFFPVLWKTAETQGADISDLTQITLVQDILSQEKLFQKERLEQEIKQLMREYKNTPWTLEELIRGGKIPPEKLGFYPEIKKMTRLFQLRDRVSLGDLMTQIETLTGRILEKLIKTPEERSLWERTEKFYLTKRILLLQATPSDIRAYDAIKETLEADVSEELRLSLEFYDTVKKRDEIFFNRIMNDPSLTGNIAIVTGGFHTDGLSQRFRDAGISYITITPELGGTSMNEKLYNERMSEKTLAQDPVLDKKRPSLSRVDDQTLSELRNAIARIDPLFYEALEILVATKNLTKARASVMGIAVSLSEPEQVSRLRSQGRLRKNASPDLMAASAFRESDFMTLSRSKQLESIRRLMDQAERSEQKALVIIGQSGIQTLQEKLRGGNRPDLLEKTLSSGDVFAVLGDTNDIPEVILGKRNVRRFPLQTVAELLAAKGFLSLRKSFPNLVIIQDGYQGDFVALPEQPASLLLYRIIALSPNLYQAAKNPAFLALLQNLVTEILSQELFKKSV